MLQFITNTESRLSVIEQIEKALEGGCRWIQIRMKDASDEEIKQVVDRVKPACEKVDGFLLLDDRVELAKELNVGGVHLGKDDMAPSKARAILGAAAVIGVTANTITDIEAVSFLDIDYFGIGPFRETPTKKNLAPVLGIAGIRDITLEMRQKEINIPAVAIGGIKADDVTALMETGVNGVAVSGAIANASNPVEETSRIIRILDQFAH